jgi:hypothetical protein
MRRLRGSWFNIMGLKTTAEAQSSQRKIQIDDI